MNDTTPCIQNARYIHPFIAPVANTPGRKKKMPLPPARIDRRGPHGMDDFEKLCVMLSMCDDAVRESGIVACARARAAAVTDQTLSRLVVGRRAFVRRFPERPIIDRDLSTFV